MAAFESFLRRAAVVAGEALYTGKTALRTFKKYDDPIALKQSDPIPFSYVGTDEEADYQGMTYYSDDYFRHSGTEYDLMLGTSSIALAMACGNSHKGYKKGYINAEALLRDMGFSDIWHNTAYEKVPSVKTMGVVIATRKLEGCTLVCMGLRGICYGSEWGANLLLGKGRFHKGFDKASNIVLRALRSYLRSHGVSGRMKLWVTGYSRSASVTNLTAAKIDIAISEGTLGDLLCPEVSMDVSDVYAYCFEPAETVVPGTVDVHGPVYGNIWNHVNPCDPVPILVTQCFGMERFGTDLDFPCPSDLGYRRERDRMLAFYNRLENRDKIGHYRIDHFTVVEVKSLGEEGRKLSFSDPSEFIQRVNQCFSECLGSREYYVENIEAALSNVIAENRDITGSRRFEDEFWTAISEDKLAVIRLLIALEKDDFIGSKNALTSPVTKAVRKSGVEEVTVEQFTTALVEILFIFKGFFRGHRALFFHFLVNSKTIFFAHYPELAFAWMMSLDPRYGR